MPNVRTFRWVLVANTGYGLFIGETDADDEEIVRDKTVRLRNVRHVARWFGRTGGISSLAQHGPCGRRAGESLIGAPCPSALITLVQNVFDLSDEAVAAFARIATRDA